MESASGRLSEADLRGYFGKYGEVMHALVLSDKDRRGFGCVTFKDLETINIVIREESSVRTCLRGHFGEYELCFFVLV